MSVFVYFWKKNPIIKPPEFAQPKVIPQIDFEFLKAWSELKFSPFATTSQPETFGRENPFEKPLKKEKFFEEKKSSGEVSEEISEIEISSSGGETQTSSEPQIQKLEEISPEQIPQELKEFPQKLEDLP